MNFPHLVGRFLGTLRPGGPSKTSSVWVSEILSGREFELWATMAAYDRRHSVRVAESAVGLLAQTHRDRSDTWAAAALLHDIGKTQAGFGRIGRVGATVAGWMMTPGRLVTWSTRPGLRRRTCQYLSHGPLGAEMIRSIGGSEEAAIWSMAHHSPSSWPYLGFPNEVVGALATSDGDAKGRTYGQLLHRD